MRRSSKFRNLHIAVVFVGAAFLAGARPVAAIEECDGEQWQQAVDCFQSECFYMFWNPSHDPPLCGEGYPDNCWVEEGRVFWTGWCQEGMDCMFYPDFCV